MMKLKHPKTVNDGPEAGSGEPVESRFVAWKFSLAVVIAINGLVASIFVLFPMKNGPFAVLASKLRLPGAAQHFPEGQLQADAKTFVATLEWLFLPDIRPAALSTPTNQPIHELSANPVKPFRA